MNLYAITIEHTTKCHLLIYNNPLMNRYHEKVFLHHFHTNYHLMSMYLHLPSLVCAKNTTIIPFICMQLAFHTHLKTIYLYIMTFLWTFIMITYFNIIFIWINTSWECVYIELHWPACINTTTKPSICTQLL